MGIRHLFGGRQLLVLITYDVNTETDGGRRRLRKIAKECVNYGQRVQKSVFECELDAAQYRLLRGKLEEIINDQEDSIRFYNLGNKSSSRIEVAGKNDTYQAKGYLTI